MEDRLTDRRRIRALQEKHGFAIRKRWGQNFVVDDRVLRTMVEKAGVAADDAVLEIGPGFGSLTRELAAAARQVVAVELDRKLKPVLEETLAGCPNTEVVFADILEQDLDALIGERLHPGPAGAVRVVANLPYYVTTPILMHLLETTRRIASVTIMTQKEVAGRIQANPGSREYGALSVAVQYRTRPEVVCRVPPGSFYPRPRVESAVIHLPVRSVPAVHTADPGWMMRVVRAAFGQRRKMLSNALPAGLPEMGREEIRRVLREVGLDPARRGETLSLEEFARLSDALEAARKGPGGPPE